MKSSTVLRNTTDGKQNATDRRIHRERISSCKKLPIMLSEQTFYFLFLSVSSEMMLNRCVEFKVSAEKTKTQSVSGPGCIGGESNNWRIINYFYRLFFSLPFTNTFQLIPIEKALRKKRKESINSEALSSVFLIGFAAFTNKRRFFLEANRQREKLSSFPRHVILLKIQQLKCLWQIYKCHCDTTMC
jgi:hypothetical protein